MQLRSSGGSSLAVGVAIWWIAVAGAHATRAGAQLAAKFQSASEGEVDAARKALAAPHGETRR